MSIISKLNKIKDALNQVNISTFHYFAMNKTNDYIVWAEHGETESLDLDNKKEEQVISGAIDLFTKKEYDPIIDEIQDTLNKNDIAYRLSDVQYEEETKFIHYTWEWEL